MRWMRTRIDERFEVGHRKPDAQTNKICGNQFASLLPPARFASVGVWAIIQTTVSHLCSCLAVGILRLFARGSRVATNATWCITSARMKPLEDQCFPCRQNKQCVTGRMGFDVRPIQFTLLSVEYSSVYLQAKENGVTTQKTARQ